MHIAIYNREVDIIILLINHDINIIYDLADTGMNALFIALWLQPPDNKILEILLAQKPNLSSKYNGLTLSNYAEIMLKNEHKETYDMIMTAIKTSELKKS